MQKKGMLYGIGVGPGDPQLMTLKAVDVLQRSAVIAIPDSGKHGVSVAYEIARQAVPVIEQKEQLVLAMPMSKAADLLAQSHEQAVERIAEKLEEGKDVAFITLGDPSIYSTFLYMLQRVRKRGYDVEMIPGVPSFCAVAAKLGIGLAEADQPLHIIPAVYGKTEEALSWPGTKVIMKMGRSAKQVFDALRENNLLSGAQMVENCGLPEETVWLNLEQIQTWEGQPGYFTMIVVKDDKEDGQK